MRGPSRQITSRLVAGAFGRAATARARSATIRPSAPSATPESVSARPGVEQFGGGFGGRLRHQAAPREVAHPAEQRRVVVRRRVGRAHDPGEQVRLRHVHQPLELVDLGLAQRADMRVREAPGDQVDLAHAAMPGAEQQAPPPLVQAFARNRGSAHLFRNTKSPDVPGEADIAAERPHVSKEPKLSSDSRAVVGDWTLRYGGVGDGRAVVRTAVSGAVHVSCVGAGRAFPRPRAARLRPPADRSFDDHGALQRADVPVLGGPEQTDPAGLDDPRSRQAARQLDHDPRRSDGAVRRRPHQGLGRLQRLGLQLVLPQRLEALLSQMVRRRAALRRADVPADRRAA